MGPEPMLKRASNRPPDCIVPWCERRMHTRNDQGLCKECWHWWRMHIAAHAMAEAAREDAQREAEESPLWIPEKGRAR